MRLGTTIVPNDFAEDFEPDDNEDYNNVVDFGSGAFREKDDFDDEEPAPKARQPKPDGAKRSLSVRQRQEVQKMLSEEATARTGDAKGSDLWPRQVHRCDASVAADTSRG